MAAPDFEYRVAETREDIEGAVRLVYHNYVEQGYCRLNRFEVHFYLYDVLPETRVLVALADGRVVATLTLVFDSQLGLPSGKLYRAELDGLRSAGRRPAEISKLAVDRSLGARGLAVLKGLFRLGWCLASGVRGASDFVILVEPHHEAFYVKGMLFERLGELKPDPDAEGAPSVLLRLDLTDAPQRYLQRFGEAPGKANPYWFFCLSPESAAARAHAESADGRLTEMNRKVETGARLASPTVSERRYVDYRLFAIAFNTDQVCRQAAQKAGQGLFRGELELFQRLLAVLPPNYAPERRGNILLQMTLAAWHGAMYERALALADSALELLTGADAKANAHHMAGVALHFLGRGNEAVRRLRQGLEVPGISSYMRGKLLRLEGRHAIEVLAFANGRRSLQAARAELERAEDTADCRKLRCYLAHDIHVLEYRSGNVAAARAIMEEAREMFIAAGGEVIADYHEGLCKLEAISLRPRAVLEHTATVISYETPDSSRYNAAIPRYMAADAREMLGELDPARKLAEEALALSRASRQPSMIVLSLGLLAGILLAGDDEGEAARLVDEELASALGTGGGRARAYARQIEAELWIHRRTWDRAREARRQAAELLRPEPALGALARCAQVQVELLSGSARMARRLAEGLPAPAEMPGYLLYEARFRVVDAVLLACAGDAAGGACELKAGLDLYRPGGAVNSMAEAALLAAEALANCRAVSKAPGMVDLCRGAVAEALAAARLPRSARRARELGWTT